MPSSNARERYKQALKGGNDSLRELLLELSEVVEPNDADTLLVIALIHKELGDMVAHEMYAVKSFQTKMQQQIADAKMDPFTKFEGKKSDRSWTSPGNKQLQSTLEELCIAMREAYDERAPRWSILRASHLAVALSECIWVLEREGLSPEPFTRIDALAKLISGKQPPLLISDEIRAILVQYALLWKDLSDDERSAIESWGASSLAKPI